MSAWDNDLGALRVQRVTLPRDGGVRNRERRFDYAATDLRKTFAAERRRIKASAQQELPLAPAFITPNTAPEAGDAATAAVIAECHLRLQDAEASGVLPFITTPRRSRQRGRICPDTLVLVVALLCAIAFTVLALSQQLPGSPDHVHAPA